MKKKPTQKLTCAFSSPWKSDPWGCGPCLKCQAYSAELSRQFEVDLFFGLHDARGYPIRAPKKSKSVRRTDTAA